MADDDREVEGEADDEEEEDGEEEEEEEDDEGVGESEDGREDVGEVIRPSGGAADIDNKTSLFPSCLCTPHRG